MGRGQGGGHSVMFALTGEMRMGPSNCKRKQTGGIMTMQKFAQSVFKLSTWSINHPQW